MSSSFFFLQAGIENPKNHGFIENLRAYSEATKIQIYVIDRPLGDSKYTYDHKDGLVVLAPKHKLIFIDFSDSHLSFEDFVDDFIEDLGSISDKFRYKEHIGRPKNWSDLIYRPGDQEDINDIGNLFLNTLITDPLRQRVAELLLSLLTGSINDISKVRVEIPLEVLDKVKQKIVLFDGDQSRFIYQRPNKQAIKIQGLSGTGKTELLLHKLKELYVENSTDRIVFTCHNKILADSLRRRIPEFFDFMKVEQQIQWESRLWCMHAWGSQSMINSGTYRYICQHYQIPFETYSPNTTFENICLRAIKAINQINDVPPPFDYILIDESQDFPESFFTLCKICAGKAVYIAGDIFQSIFDDPTKDSTDPDFLLSKCYRTDPRTLMFAHALGMGLFEAQKLRWLEDSEWEACGYIVSSDKANVTYRLSREPLRRFEDVDWKEHRSIELISLDGLFYQHIGAAILDTIRKILSENPTAGPDDIGVVLLDKSSKAYALADSLEIMIPRELGWPINKAYETKRKSKGELFVSNRNNVKGLEFPFVICVTEKIYDSHGYRNALYMTMTRSFLQTYLLVSAQQNSALIANIGNGLEKINLHGYIETNVPSPAEADAIKTTITHTDTAVSFFDLVTKVFDELSIPPLFRDPLFEAAKTVIGEDYDYETIKDFVSFNYTKMDRGNR